MKQIKKTLDIGSLDNKTLCFTYDERNIQPFPMAAMLFNIPQYFKISFVLEKKDFCIYIYFLHKQLLSCNKSLYEHLLNIFLVCLNMILWCSNFGVVYYSLNFLCIA